jgi:hypothetical protein
MAHPILLLGLALGAGLAWVKRSNAKAVPATTDAALIDPAEKGHPNAENARLAIVNAMAVNSVTLYEQTAKAIETQLRMPKTAGHLRTWSTMAQQGGHTIAGDDDGEVGSSAPPAAAKRLPDWLRFSATQSKLVGDPRLIRATADVMRSMGYGPHADLHLRALDAR